MRELCDLDWLILILFIKELILQCSYSVPIIQAKKLCVLALFRLQRSSLNGQPGGVFSTVTSQPEAPRSQVLLCIESACSLLHLHGLSGYSGSLPQSKDMHFGDRRIGDSDVRCDCLS